MLDSHTLVLASLVSEATFALTLALLAWSDRRTKGMIWLSIACALQLIATGLRPLWKLPGDRAAQAAASCIIVLTYFFVYMGLRWFVTRRRLNSIGGPMLVSLAMTIVVAVNPFSTNVALAVARLAAIAIMGRTVQMLLHTRFVALQRAALVTAGLLSVMIVLMALRIPVDLGVLRLDASAELGIRATLFTATGLLAFSFVGMFVAETTRRLHQETRTDPLTGLRNRRAIEEIAMLEVAAARRMGSPLHLLMLDIDHFKRLNDTWGHALGDRALRALSGVLLTVTGADDRVTRMGGEEFAVLLPGCDTFDAREVAERLRATVEGLRLNEKEEVASFTVSIGISAWRHGEDTWHDMLRRADEALYRAKREGRNRVIVGGMDAPEEDAEARIAWRTSGPRTIASA